MAAPDSKLMALAGVYAEGLFEAAREAGQEDEVASELADLVAYLDRAPDFDTFLSSRSIDDDSRQASLEKLFRGRMNDLLVNLLQVLNRRGRLALVRAVERCVQLRIAEEHCQQEVIVETAMPLSEALRAVICKDLSARTGKEALLVEQVRPELIGGMIIHVADQQIDASVASRIRWMRKRLTERGTEAIHSGRFLAVET